MNPGLPGTGIGGLFYTVSALWMPVCEIWRWIRGTASGRWPLVARQFAIALGVIAAMTAVFWVLDTTFMLQEAARQAAGKAETVLSLRISALLVTAGVLVTLLGVVHLARLLLWLRAARTAGR
jgi:hypothetical protein